MTETRPQNPREQRFASSLPQDALSAIQKGVMQTQYRGRRLLKSPFDLVLYLQLLEHLRPASIIEIGSKEGGSALWFADQTRIIGFPSAILSIDLCPPIDCSHPQIRFARGDALALHLIPDISLENLPKPWLISEDSAHTYEACSAVLEFFHPHLVSGDYVVVEDGIVADLPGEQYAAFANGPNRAVRDFLARHGDAYQVDEKLCDFYGENVTWNPNGWIRKK